MAKVTIQTRHLGGKYSLNVGGSHIVIEMTDEQMSFLEKHRKETEPQFDTIEQYLFSYNHYFAIGGTIENFIAKAKDRIIRSIKSEGNKLENLTIINS